MKPIVVPMAPAPHKPIDPALPDDVREAVERVRAEFDAAYASGRMRLFAGPTYTVTVDYDPPGIGPTWPAMWELSIHRNDREPVHDWRDFQAIKNAIAGPEREAVELYPAESRLMDAANEYHLWVLADAEMQFPFGSTERTVGGAKEASMMGARQRDPGLPGRTAKERRRFALR